MWEMADKPTSRSPPPSRSDNSSSTASYLLRKLIGDVPLSADGEVDGVHITCVEVLQENLYIGTSAAEILHFVHIPPDPNDPTDEGQYILASRQEPAHNHATPHGIQQILLLPKVNKACVLCNNTLSFYSLPELTPAFPSTKPFTCSYVGGLDENLDEDVGPFDNGVLILVCQKSRMRLVRVNEDGPGPKSIRNIEYGSCLTSVRRGDVACSADAHSYALLDVEHQQKVPLFPISSLDEAATSGASLAPQDISEQAHGVSRSTSSAGASARSNFPSERTHGRSTSLGLFGDQRRLESPRPLSARYGFDAPETFARSRSPFQPPSPAERSPERSVDRSGSPALRVPSPEKALPSPPTEVIADSSAPPPPPPPKFIPLKPLIVSPTPNEFLLTTGTTPTDPGVGMFVNMDGDVVRGTLEFSTYPTSLIVDGKGMDPSASMISGHLPEEGYVLATLTKQVDGEFQSGVEIQRWDQDPGANISREWLHLPTPQQTAREAGSATPISGLRTVNGSTQISLREIGRRLVQRHLDIRTLSHDKSKERSSSVDEKGAEEFVRRLSEQTTRNVLWANNHVWWVVRNPLVLKLDARLDVAYAARADNKTLVEPNREQIIGLLDSIRGSESFTEVDFLGLSYIRQKASVLLFIDLIIRTSANYIVFEVEKRSTEEALIEGEVDPRLILALLPIFREEVIQGSKGISIVGGLQNTIVEFLQRWDSSQMSLEPTGPFGDNLLQLIKRYLLHWRRKKGMASITDDKEVFQTVDAALLHVLLLLDRQQAPGVATPGSLRAELNSVVDGGIDCFERAVALLEKFQRLYVLSRLYQSKQMSSMVLATWRRIIDGETDLGGEFVDGEQAVRKYLARIRDASLVEEYGTWLAQRNPTLGVQIFADDSSRVRFAPAQAVEILKAKAPLAVKEYLEHLVFGKKLSQYGNDLISFYLDNVIEELEASPDVRTILLQTYETYRALHPPKPTYRQFITENALDAEWWNSRLRLLQLLGSNYGEASSTYDISDVLARLEPYEQELVPEMIILNGRRGRHEHAIRLLTHGLGDFDTAISYCLLGGSSIFRPASGFVPQDAIPERDEQAKLFKVLLHEFLRIEDLNDRIERTGELLERFGGWFDVVDVLSMLPDSWSIEIFSGFLISALRRLVREKSESSIAKALSGAQNLKTSADLIERVEELGPVVERAR